MVDLKTVVVSVVAVLSVFLQPGIIAQPTIDSYNEEDSCSQLEEGCEFEAMENMRLRSVLESKRQKIEALEKEIRRSRALEYKPVTAKFIGSFEYWPSHHGITKVEDKIYVFEDFYAEYAPGLTAYRIKVHDDRNGFPFRKDITLNRIHTPKDIVYSNKSKCVYISDYGHECIWVMTTTGEHRLTKWMTNITWPYTLSLSNEGHLLVLRNQRFSQSFSQDSLEIYSLNATLIRRIDLPQDVKDPEHVVQTSTGDFVIPHQLKKYTFLRERNGEPRGHWEISQLTNDGQLINRFIPRNQSEELDHPRHMSLDSDNNRLFLADSQNGRVIVFDSRDLTWRQVLLSRKTNGISSPNRLFYDANKKHLFVAQSFANVNIYEIN